MENQAIWGIMHLCEGPVGWCCVSKPSTRGAWQEAAAPRWRKVPDTSSEECCGMCSSPEPGPAFQCLLMEADRQTAGRDRGFLQLAAPQTAGGLQRLQLACHTLQKPRDRCAQCGMLWCSFLPMRRGWRMLSTAVAVQPHLQACHKWALPPHEDFAKMHLVLCVCQHHKCRVNAILKKIVWIYKITALDSDHPEKGQIHSKSLPLGFSLEKTLCTWERRFFFLYFPSLPSFLPTSGLKWLCAFVILFIIWTDFCLTSSVNVTSVCCS